MGLAWPTAEPRGSEHWMGLEEGGVSGGRVCSMASDGCKERKMELAHPYVWRLGFLSQPWTLLIKDLWAQRCQKLLSGNNDNEIRGVCVCVCVCWVGVSFRGYSLEISHPGDFSQAMRHDKKQRLEQGKPGPPSLAI